MITKENISFIFSAIRFIGVSVFIILSICYIFCLTDYNRYIKKAEKNNDEESIKKYRRKKEKLNDIRNIWMTILLVSFASSYYLIIIKNNITHL